MDRFLVYHSAICTNVLPGVMPTLLQNCNNMSEKGGFQPPDVCDFFAIFVT